MASRAGRYRIDPTRPVEGEVRRIAVGLLDDASLLLRQAPTAHADARLHERLAELRALLRLSRSGLDGAARRSAAARARSARRAIPTPGNDLLDSFDEFAGSAAETLRADALARLRGALAEPPSAPPPRRGALVLAVAGQSVLDDDGVDREDLADELDAAVLAASLWRVEGEGFAVLAPGVEREYRRAREALLADRADLSLESTRVQTARAADHVRHLRLLRSIWPSVQRAVAHEAAALAALTDHQHRAGALRAALVDLDGSRLRRDAAALVAVLDQDRADLTAEISALAARLFAEPPPAYAARTSAWWSAAQG